MTLFIFLRNAGITISMKLFSLFYTYVRKLLTPRNCHTLLVSKWVVEGKEVKEGEARDSRWCEVEEELRGRPWKVGRGA